MPLREDFPAKNTEYLGGKSDGFVYRTAFAGADISHSYEMLRQFLAEEGFANVPLPANAGELQKFRLRTRNRQILLFDDNGYVHNPVKILFPADGRSKRILYLEIYNENSPGHLLRFHRRLDGE
ncbi:MAG: hypothetical protein EPO28_03560 [Saprospiraceae bacterium]|nr:MAG: hypothetical protein EPO28_03560 [Saprospiraceae bacterium]